MEKNEILKILAEAVSTATQLSVDEIDYNESFENYGIESAMMIAIIKNLESIFGELPKTIFFEYDNINEVADYILSQNITNYQSVEMESIDKTQLEKSSNLSVVNEINDANGYLEERIEDEKSDDTFELDDIISKVDENDLTIDFDKVLNYEYSSNENSQEQEISGEIAIIGLSGKFPMADNLNEFWDNLLIGKDCIEEIPIDLWDKEKYWDKNKGVEGKSYSKWGGFIKDTKYFDPLFFNISNLEASMIDPQERKFLEVVYHTLENAGYTKESLSQNIVGVYVGVMWGQYQLYGVKKANAQSSYASIANRVSYFFDFNGPSIALDTMCSSSLTSLHLACQSIKNGECELAIAGGVNLTVHPNKYIYLSKTGFASSDGRCRSFGEGGDGYVPGDGVGALLLKPLNKAIKDHDNIWGIIKSTTLNHGGKAKGFTVPNSKQQTTLIKNGIKKAGIDVNELSYLEMHGTGTALGDPIELRAYNNAIKEITNKDKVFPIGSVKSNIGHLESAAGIASIAKVLLQMKHNLLVPSIHSTRLNQNINFKELPFYVQQKVDDWNEKDKYASISSFGAGGSNAYVILKNFNASNRKNNIYKKSFYILFSAKTISQLNKKIQDFYEFLNNKYSLGELILDFKKKREELIKECFGMDILENKYVDPNSDIKIFDIDYNSLSRKYIRQEEVEHYKNCKNVGEFISLLEKSIVNNCFNIDNDIELGDISYTLQVGRENMKYRTVFECNTLFDLFDALQNIVSKKTKLNYFEYSDKSINHLSEEENNIIKKITALNDEKYLVKLWTKGININFSELYKNSIYRKVTLPEYPFEKELCWIEDETNSIDISENEKQKLFYTLPDNICFESNINLEKLNSLNKLDDLYFEINDETVIGKDKFNEIIKGKVVEEKYEAFNDIHKHYANIVKSDDRSIAKVKYNTNEKLYIGNNTISLNLVLDSIKKLSYGNNVVFDLINNDREIKYLYIDFNNKSLRLYNVNDELILHIYETQTSDLGNKMYLPFWQEIDHEYEKNSQIDKVYIYNEKYKNYFSDLKNNNLHIIIGKDDQPNDSDNKIYCQDIYDLETYINILDSKKIYYFGFNVDTNFNNNIINELVLPFWKFVNFLGNNGERFDLTLVTNNSWKINEQDVINPMSSLLIGIGKSSGKEFKNINFNHIDIDIFEKDAIYYATMLKVYNHHEICLRNRLMYTQSFKELNENNNLNSFFNSTDTVILVGGAGTVGRLITKYILEKNPKCKIIWIGRRKINLVEIPSTFTNNIIYFSCDVTNFDKLNDLFDSILKSFGKIDIVMNLAMDFSIDRLKNITAEYISEKLQPKLQGNINLYRIAKEKVIKKLVFFSSGESFTCNIGWGIYASSCIFTDSLKEYINTNNLVDCISINWGFWENKDSTINEQFKAKGINPINYKLGGKALDNILLSNFKQVLFLDVSENIKEKMGIITAKQENIIEETEISPVTITENIDEIALTLKKSFEKVLKISEGKIDVYEDLATYGVDSLLITSIHKEIVSVYGDVPVSVILEGPSIYDIAKYIYENKKVNDVISIVESSMVETYLTDYGNKFLEGKFTISQHLSKNKIVELSDENLLHFKIDVENTNLEVFMYGKGKPVLFLPAIGLTAPSFINQFISLSNEYKVIVIHAPGYGLSGMYNHFKTNYIGDLMYQAIRFLFDTKISIVSSCFGTILGTYLAYRYSKLISSLTLIGGFYDGSDLPSIDIHNMTSEELLKMTNVISESISKDFDMLKNLEGINIQEIEKSKEILLSSKCSNSLVAIRYLNEMFELNTLKWVEKITIPVLCMYGDHDSIIKPIRTQEIAKKLHNCKLYEFNSCGHYPYLTHSSKFNLLLKEFLNEVGMNRDE